MLHKLVTAARDRLPSRRANDHRRMIEDFADRSNMVYFGFVSQMTDEHKIVRGMTVSTKHADHHYCIGTHHGYDVVFVERSDTLLTSGHKHTWHIMQFDLTTTSDVPHFFIGSSNHGNGFHSLLSAKYSSMISAILDHTIYPDIFTGYFSIFATPANTILVEQLITPDVAEMIGKHFKGLVIEVANGSLFVYSEKSHLSGGLLDTMIANGVWLARQLDEKSQRL